MKYKILNLNAVAFQDIVTELMFEVASAKVGGVELLRFNIAKGSGEKAREADKKIISAVSRILKTMKQKGTIQFFAFPGNFSAQGTEARFLINKYPQIFVSIPLESDSETFVFIKL